MQKPDKRVILDITHKVTPETGQHYLEFPFVTGENTQKVRAVLTFYRKGFVQMFLALFDPQNFRGNRMDPFTRGEVKLDLWVGVDQAGDGGIPGKMPAGEWKALIDIGHIHEPITFRLKVDCETGTNVESLPVDSPGNIIHKNRPGWYAGELHCHSSESDGVQPVKDVVQAAVDAGLDYLAITDHFTSSQWRKLLPLASKPVALLQSCEITSHRGHANLHGLNRWVDVFVDRPTWGFNQAAEDTHKQGGLFCVNHPFSGPYGWADPLFDWKNADLLEIYHGMEGCNNSYQLGLWDQQLNLGRKIIGVGGSDSHDPYHEHQRFGRLVTYVYADKLSEAGIIAGLKRGRVYVSQGAQLDFIARGENGETAHMWETLPTWQQPVKLEVEYQTDTPLLLFIIRNGYILTQSLIEGAPGTKHLYSFTDIPQKPSYYRIELHLPYGGIGSKDFPGTTWRDYSTMQALSNPIWVGQRQNIG